MKIKCIRKDCVGLSDLRISQIRERIPEGQGPFVTVGKEYRVFGIAFFHNAPWYYILEDQDNYPMAIAGDFFEIIDPAFEPDWELQTRSMMDGSIASEIVFKEWARDFRFYERLLDDEDRELAQFEIYRKRLGV